MHNLFSCTACGTENQVGNAACSRCGFKFQYYCPQCRSVVNGDDPACRSCGHALNWPSRAINTDNVKEKQAAEHVQREAGSWLLPLIGLILIIATAGAGVFVIMKMAAEPSPPLVTDNFTAVKKDEIIIPDTSAPQISSIEIISISYNVREIHWITDKPSTSQVIWRIKDGNVAHTEKKEAMVVQHSVELTSLKNKSTYYFQVKSVGQAGIEAVSTEDKFDIGIPRGIASVEVAWNAMKTVEQQPSVFKTVVSGEIKNTGDVTLNIKDIEITITVSVAGKPGTSQVIASLDPYPLELYPQAVHKFSAEVPSRTDPVYSITTRVINQ